MVQIKEVPQHIDAGLLECEPEPTMPEGELTSKVVAKLLVDTTIAGRDCRGKLEELKTVVGQ